MKKQDFIKELAEELEVETEVSNETKFEDLDEWDSMSILVLMGYVSDKFGLTLNADDVSELTTFESLIIKIGRDNFDD